MSNFEKAIEIIMGEPPEAHYPSYYASLLREADVPDKDVGKCSEIPNSSDTISRQAAIDAIDELDWYHHGIKEMVKGANPAEHQAWYKADDVYKALDSLPPAEPERIKGHWIEITSSNHTYKCSVCGRLLVNITDGKNNVAKNYPYCHCGADMGEGEQDDKCRQV